MRIICPSLSLPAPDDWESSGSDRIAILTATATTPLVLLVETRAAFFSEMSGQYRWTVSVRVTLADAWG